MTNAVCGSFQCACDISTVAAKLGLNQIFGLLFLVKTLLLLFFIINMLFYFTLLSSFTSIWLTVTHNAIRVLIDSGAKLPVGISHCLLSLPKTFNHFCSLTYLRHICKQTCLSNAFT